MPFEQQTLRDLLEERVSVSPPVRIALAVSIIAGGLCFVAVGSVAFFFVMSSVQPVHKVAAAALSVAVAMLGVAFLWLGIRLARTRADRHKLLSAVARRRCSLIVGGLAACMLAGAYEANSILYLASAVGMVVFSYWLFPLDRR